MPIFTNNKTPEKGKRSRKPSQKSNMLRQNIEQIMQDKQTFALTLDTISDGVIVTDVDGYIILCNKVVERIMEFDPGEAINKHVSLIYTQWNVNSLAKATDIMDKIFSEQKPYHTKNTVAIVTKKKHKRNVDISVTPIIISGNQCLGYIITCQDRTDTVRMQEEIFNSKKLESVGLLAGGIAHDFNNVLTSIMGNITLAKIYSNPRDKAYEILIEAEKACMQSKELTQQLLTFSRGGNPIKKITKITNIIVETADYTVRNSDIQVEYHIDDDIPNVEVDEGQINQVANNLITNAMQAMNGKGTIEISIRRKVTEPHLHIADASPDELIQVDIKDSGCGIEADDLDKIFDPYYTTKPDSTGLGLAISHSIIRKHGGHLLVQSEVGVGSIFTILLPISKKQEPKQQTEGLYLRHKNLHILVMDDEQSIRDITGKLLSLMGHEVEFAADGEEAISLYKARYNANNKFDAVFMDLVVPGKMGGEIAVGHILDIDPRAVCIISSGYSTGEVMSKYTELGFKGIITKPFKVEDLIKVLNETI